MQRFHHVFRLLHPDVIQQKELFMPFLHKNLQRLTLLLAAIGLIITTANTTSHAAAQEIPKVYFTKDISPAGMQKLYKLVNNNITGKVGVKVHTGEPNAPYIIPRDMVKVLTDAIPNSTIVETNVYYPSPRQNTEGHRKTLVDNGWTFAPVDILDEEGDINLPVPGGKWFKELAMGSHIRNYDSLLVLTHFKGHTMGGFGGSLKNIAIGMASGKVGKKQLHASGDNQWGITEERFMEHMAESGKAVTTHFGKNMAYINVLNNISVDCDCAGSSAKAPTAPDLGILASTDILAIDQASIDMIYALPQEERKHLVERIESRKGLHQLDSMEKMGMGSRKYELVVVD